MTHSASKPDPIDDFHDITPDEHAQRESQELMGLLRQQREQLGVGDAVPDNDTTLSQKVLSDAKTRSQEIRDAAALVAGSERDDRIQPVPAWLKWAWVLAIIVVIGLLIWQNMTGQPE